MIYLNDKPVVIDRFPNGESRIPLVDGGTKPVIRLRWESDADLMHLVFVRRMCDTGGSPLLRKPWLDIEYMPYSRMDRPNDDFAFTLENVCALINWLDFVGVSVWEPHSDKTCELLNYATPVWPTMKLLPKVMEEVGFDMTDVVVFPDLGAGKRYERLLTSHLPPVIFDKTRDFASGQVTGMEIARHAEGLANAKRAIIVDDLCSYGGTFKRCAELVRAVGVEEVYLLVAHLERSVYKGELLRTHYGQAVTPLINHIFATESLQTNKEIDIVPGSDKVTLYRREEWR